MEPNSSKSGFGHINAGFSSQGTPLRTYTRTKQKKNLPNANMIKPEPDPLEENWPQEDSEIDWFSMTADTMQERLASVAVCRLCVATQVQMHNIVNTPLQGVYEKLTTSTFDTVDRPVVACKFCFEQLKSSLQLMKRAVKAEKMLTRLLIKGEAITPESVSKLDRIPLLKLSNMPKEEATKINKIEIEVPSLPQGVTVKKEVEDKSTEEQLDTECAIPPMMEHHIKIETCQESESPQFDPPQKITPKKESTKNYDMPLYPFICDHCTRSYKNKSSLTKHMKCHNQSEYNCKKCEFKSVDQESLVKHARVHENLEVKIAFKCHICGLVCNSQEDFDVHRNSHIGEKLFKYTKRKKVKGHMQKVIRTNDGNIYQCVECKKKFTVQNALYRHIRVHTKEKPYVCIVCGFKCSQKSNMNKHLQTHTGVKSYKCPLCDYKCIQKTSLKAHVKNHSGEKESERERVFQCAECSYKCVRKDHLINHLKIHSGDKPFECAVCGYKCIQKSNLKTHFRMHTGERPYTCVLCGCKFAQRSHLREHYKKHEISG